MISVYFRPLIKSDSNSLARYFSDTGYGFMDKISCYDGYCIIYFTKYNDAADFVAHFDGLSIN